jgi:hypothetical protein
VALNKKVDKDRPVLVPTSSVVEVANSIGKDRRRRPERGGVNGSQ